MIYNISSIDISKIPHGMSFFIDTNVLLFIHFGAQTLKPNSQKISAYSNFIGKLINQGVGLFVSTFNLQEMFHVIEDTEFKRIQSTNPKFFNKKTFRNDARERKKTQGIINGVMAQITSASYQFVSGTVEETDTNAFLYNYCSHVYDPIDFFVVEHNCQDCANFITDDHDFRKDSRLNIYTYA